MNKLFTLIFISFFAANVYSQGDVRQSQPGSLVRLSSTDSVYFCGLPQLRLPAYYTPEILALLPASVDNSTQPCWRPVFAQVSSECGQASSVGQVFTYEVNRVRNLLSNVPQNQYVTHFAWNFINGGTGLGASFIQTFELLRMVGTPSVVDYGGSMSYGGTSRWMSGYDNYYATMKNRISSVNSIQVGTPDGLVILKQWIMDHLEGSSVGGVACFYSQFFSPTNTLPAGTPEAGKYVQTAWGGSPNHSMTIAGYNDSIRFDYNSDGQYTNNIDINLDGTVNMKDWEIGGLKFCNNYAGGPSWGNSGFCYMMYKTLADNIGSGGIWNHAVFVENAKVTQDPQLTLKVKLRHTSREKIKITAGVAENLSAARPEHIMEFPMMNYQGGDFNMQGDTNKTIEFGLDITPLLSNFPTGTPAKYFFQVYEIDPSAADNGQIVSVSLMDYTNGVYEVPFMGTAVSINNNDTTRVAITRTVNFNEVGITTASMPPARVNDFYTYQLQAANGTQPYRWDIDFSFQENVTTGAVPVGFPTQLVTNNDDNGYATVNLGFNFPFYGKTYNKLYIHADGYISFDDQPYTWPYYYSESFLAFKKTKNISVYNDDLYLYSSNGGGIWYEGDAGSAVIKWKASVNGSITSNLNFAVKLYPNGKLEYYYGIISGQNGEWFSGMSSGTPYNYQLTSVSNKTGVTTNTKLEFLCPLYPVEMTLSEDGVFSGTPLQAYPGSNLKFRVMDNNDIAKTRQINFYTNGTNHVVIVDDSIHAGSDTLIEYAENVNMGVTLKNIGTTTLTSGTMKIHTNDPYITITDSTVAVPLMTAASTIQLNNAFAFQVSPNVPDDYSFSFDTKIYSTPADTSFSYIYLKAFAPHPITKTTVVKDGANKILESGETSDIAVPVLNSGHAKSTNLKGILVSIDTALILNSVADSVALLSWNATDTMTFNVTAKPNIPDGYIAKIQINFTDNKGLSHIDTVEIYIGYFSEDFETNDFLNFPWSSGGNLPWTIDNVNPYEGTYSARSGAIGNNQTSSLLLEQNVLYDGNLSFYYKTSCEQETMFHNYDFLVFYMDGVEKGRWDGIQAWTKVQFPVTAGMHTYQWVYKKNASTSAGMDAVWIDYIAFPPCSNSPKIKVDPSSVEISLLTNSTATRQLIVSNIGDGVLSYNIIKSGLPVFKTNNLNHEIRSIDGAYVQTTLPSFHTGVPFAIDLNTFNPSTDAEWLKDIYLTLPAGVRVDSASDFVGGSNGTLMYDTTMGYGVTVNWHFSDGSGWGGIKGGESANAILYVYADSSFVTDLTIGYQIDGDIYGATPHTVYGSFTISNQGLLVPWLTLSDTAGSCTPVQSDTITLNFNSAGLAIGTYTCQLHFNPGKSNHTMVPIIMHVTSMEALPVSLEYSLMPDSSLTDTVMIVNHYTQQQYYLTHTGPYTPVFDSLWMTASPLIDLVLPQDTNLVILHVNANGLAYGDYQSFLTVSDIIYEIPVAPGAIPVLLHVVPYIPVVNPDNPGLAFECFPNPFNNQTQVRFTVKEPSVSSLFVYDLNGRKIATLMDKKLCDAGIQSVNWNGTSDLNSSVKPGVYYIQLKQGKQTAVKKVVLIR
ncbi:MAG: T9SS type A sorting domain-containing protein [Bacteroidota bacterium]